MPVPNTNNFSLQDILDEIMNNGGPTINSLQGANSAANLNGFDSSFSGLSGMKKWRNYRHITLDESCVSVIFEGGQFGGSYRYIPCGGTKEVWLDLKAGNKTQELCVISSSVQTTGSVVGNIQGPCSGLDGGGSTPTRTKYYLTIDMGSLDRFCASKGQTSIEVWHSESTINPRMVDDVFYTSSTGNVVYGDNQNDVVNYVGISTRDNDPFWQHYVRINFITGDVSEFGLIDGPCSGLDGGGIEDPKNPKDPGGPISEP